jgi:hypothetical protein
MTDVVSAQLPASANFINPETMHHPTGYTHVVEVTAGRPVYISGQVALDPAGVLVGPGDIRAQARQVDNPSRPSQPASTKWSSSPCSWSTPPTSRSFARSATSTSIPSSDRPALPSRSGGWSAMTCSSRSKRARWLDRWRGCLGREAIIPPNRLSHPSRQGDVWHTGEVTCGTAHPRLHHASSLVKSISRIHRGRPASSRAPHGRHHSLFPVRSVAQGPDQRAVPARTVPPARSSTCRSAASTITG